VPKRLVLSLHGIRTSLLQPGWQDELGDLVNRPEQDYQALSYGFLPAILFLIPFVRRRRLKWFRRKWERARENWGVVPSIVAHSFGTYLVAEALRNYPQMQFDCIVFCGSIVEREFPWKQIHDRKQFQQLLNQHGGIDFWAGAVQYGVRDAGPSGKDGFIVEPGAEGFVIQEKHTQWDHGDYFYKANYKRWLSFLSGEPLTNYPPVREPRPNPRPLLILGALALAMGLGLYFLVFHKTLPPPPPPIPTPAPTMTPFLPSPTIFPRPTSTQRPTASPRPSENWVIASSSTPTLSTPPPAPASTPTPTLTPTSTPAPTPTPASTSTPTPTPTSTPTPTPTSPPTQDMAQAADHLVEQGSNHLKNGYWTMAVQAFGAALQADPKSLNASNALWQALIEHSGDRLELPDRAYRWPEGASLVEVSPNEPVALIVKQGKPSAFSWFGALYLYQYESGTETPVPGDKIFTGFSGDGRYLLTAWLVLIPGAKPDKFGFLAQEMKSGLLHVDRGATREAPALPAGWKTQGRPLWHGCNLLMTDTTGAVRWWNADKADWAGAAINVPGLQNLFELDRNGRYLLWGDKDNTLHIHDLLQQKEIPTGVKYYSGRCRLSGNGRVLVVPELNQNRTLPAAALTDAFTLWTLPSAGFDAPEPVQITASGGFLLELDRQGRMFLRQRQPEVLFRWHKNSSYSQFQLPWRFHPERDELYFQSARSLCVYTLPTMPHFQLPNLPKPPAKPPGPAIESFLKLAYTPDEKQSEVELCVERDRLHAQLLEDEGKSEDQRRFRDLPEDWRKLLKWWTTKPGQRQPWPQ